jgi:hypothetical protein
VVPGSMEKHMPGSGVRLLRPCRGSCGQADAVPRSVDELLAVAASSITRRAARSIPGTDLRRTARSPPAALAGRSRTPAFFVRGLADVHGAGRRSRSRP